MAGQWAQYRNGGGEQGTGGGELLVATPFYPSGLGREVTESVGILFLKGRRGHGSSPVAAQQPFAIDPRFRENTWPYCAVFVMRKHGGSALHAGSAL